jgi:hypothetical protein
MNTGADTAARAANAAQRAATLTGGPTAPVAGHSTPVELDAVLAVSLWRRRPWTRWFALRHTFIALGAPDISAEVAEPVSGQDYPMDADQWRTICRALIDQERA